MSFFQPTAQTLIKELKNNWKELQHVKEQLNEEWLKNDLRN